MNQRGGAAQLQTKLSDTSVISPRDFQGGFEGKYYYGLTSTITTPPLTRILDRLIGGGIILCGNVV